MKYELKRLKIEEKAENIEKKLDTIFKENDAVDSIIIKLFEYLSESKIRNVVIFDQFKKNYFSYKTYDTIKGLIKNSCIGLIISSSIDEKEKKNELMGTLNRFYSMPKIISNKTQDYYIYVPDLLKNKLLPKEFNSDDKKKAKK